MATINFPDTSVNNPNTGNPWADGDTTNITADGVTITYEFKTQDNDHWWKSMGRVNNATPIDRIEEGNSSVEVVDTGANGQVIVTTEGDSRMIVNSAGNVLIGGTLPATPNITLRDDGSAEFATDRVNINTAGEATFENTDNTIARVCSGVNGLVVGDTGDDRIFLHHDGHVLTESTNGHVNINVMNAGVMTSTDGTFANRTARINHNGSAEFLGDVVIGDDPSVSNTNFGLMFRSAGGIIARRVNGTDNLWSGGTDGTNDTSLIRANGSAAFDGNVDIGGDLNTQSAIRIFANGAVSQRSDLANASQAAWQYFNGGFNDASRRAELKSDGSLLLGGTSPNDQNIKLNANGSASFAGKITLAAAGKPAGIQFGSTNSNGSITSQTLDDYEEGTWTPNFAAGTKDTSFSSRTGNYTKIGRQVTLTFVMNLDGSSAASGANYVITGFPFTVSDNLAEGSAGGGAFTRSTLIEAGNAIQLVALKNQTRASCTINGNGVANDADGTSLNGANIQGFVTYFTDD